MALPTIAVIDAAFVGIFGAANETPTFWGARKAVQDVNEVREFIRRRYTPIIDVTITDTADAGVAEAIADDGELGVALGRALDVGDVFQVGGTGDFTDDALETAKGGAAADGDIFEVSGADAVTYLGTATTLAAIGSDEETVDFVSIGS